MTLTERCKEICMAAYGDRFNQSVYDLALSRANMVKHHFNCATLDEFLEMKGCQIMLEMYSIERQNLLDSLGDDMDLGL